MTDSILVAGATGTQGGSVVDALLAAEDRPADVRGLTRHPDGDAATALRDRGVSIVEGDMTDRAAMDRAVAGVDAVFGVTAGETGDAERAQGTTLADAAAAAGVDHVVFSSGGNADRRPGIPHVDAKHDVERHLAELDVPVTVLRPHSFMRNFERQRAEILGGRLAFPLPEGATHALVDPADVGRFAARAFADPETYAGVTVELAAERLTLDELAAVFGEVIGRDVEPVHVPLDSMPGEMAAFMEFMANAEVDPDRLREEFDFEPRGLREYLVAAGWENAA
jgi:uncharacterized protein YbjT (DUF2867 family)